MNNSHDIEVPKWDIALANLVQDVYARDGVPLTLADFRNLAGQYAIRFDDIMATMLEMVAEGEWEYLNTAGERQPISRGEIDALYVNGRLNETDLRAFAGAWLPVDV
ncbi:MAG: hypothetical protein WBO06_09855 [Gammaproteobacteria bacterium]